MTVLGIDTSVRGTTVVVLAGADGDVREHVLSGALLQGLDGLLRELDLTGLEAVVVATGPGTYTGLRAGMAVALGIAHSRGLPLHGVPSLEVVAQGAPSDVPEFLAVSDAGRGGVYAQRFTRQEGEVVAEEGIRRLAVAELPPQPPAVRLDAETAPGALAAVLAVALARPALDTVGLTAVYVEATDGSRPA
jgi:tRNA threonylcarbamoyladenosine biosynthesis protein TsaB